MSFLTENQKIALRDSILSLAMSCPGDRSNPEDCPLYPMRKLELPRRLEWFNSLSEDDLIYLNSCPCICAYLKMQSRSVPLDFLSYPATVSVL